MNEVDRTIKDIRKLLPEMFATNSDNVVEANRCLDDSSGRRGHIHMESMLVTDNERVFELRRAARFTIGNCLPHSGLSWESYKVLEMDHGSSALQISFHGEQAYFKKPGDIQEVGKIVLEVYSLLASKSVEPAVYTPFLKPFLDITPEVLIPGSDPCPSCEEGWSNQTVNQVG